ncbi:MAG TPA: DUF1223 domain-containing protein [Bryobacteraceae bacterium]|nr:DUF1223 domain-containing protein [Bryobacteraceae bacterium]
MTRLLLILSMAGFAAGLAAAQARTPVLVELFTSEGCSSCPAADELLWRLEQAQPYPGIEVIALGEHVDYWNSLGWRDRFSSTLFTARQQDYGRAMRLENVYTPQMVVDGQAEFNGSDQSRASMEIRKAAQNAAAEVSLAVASPDVVHLNVERLPPGTRDADMYLAITESGLFSDVQRGENSGRRLRHAGVVRNLTTLGHFDAKKSSGYSADAKITLKPDWRRENVRLVLFVQDRATRKVIGAATLRP